MSLSRMDDFFEDLDYDLTSRLLHHLRSENELQKRARSRRNANADTDEAYSDYTPGTIWVVDDHKVHFRGTRQEQAYHEGRRPGVVLLPPDKETGFEVCWIPGSSRLTERLPNRTLVIENTAYLLCFYEWYRPRTLESKKGELTPDKLLELQHKWDGLNCNE